MSSLNSDVESYVIISKLLDSVSNIRWERPVNLVEHTGILLCKVAYSRYEVAQRYSRQNIYFLDECLITQFLRTKSRDFVSSLEALGIYRRVTWYSYLLKISILYFCKERNICKIFQNILGMFLLKISFYLLCGWISIREAGEFTQPVQI